MAPTYQIGMRRRFLEPRNRPKNFLNWKFEISFGDFSAVERVYASKIAMWALFLMLNKMVKKIKELSLNPTKVISVRLDGHGH